jgi:hypothetical protein
MNSTITTTTATIEGRPTLQITAPADTPATVVLDGAYFNVTPREAAAAACALVEVATATGSPVHAYTPHGGAFLLVVDLGTGRGLAMVWDVTTGRRTRVREVVRCGDIPTGWNLAGRESLDYVTSDAATRASDLGAVVIEELRAV